jgi:CheY-like chemotaxis protein
MDDTACIIEAHVNDNIVFIEIAKGLNREKIDLLRFKIAELLELYQIRSPRILLMVSDMDLSFPDGPNLELLLKTVLDHSKTKARFVKILTVSPFIRDFVRGRQEFAEIEVLSSLKYAINGLLSDYDQGAGTGDSKAHMISERILSAKSPAQGSETIEMRFDSESRKKLSIESMREIGDGLSIAVVDDDFVIQELIKTTFGAINAEVTAFSNGRDFVDASKQRSFDLTFLDILMPEMDGFQVLTRLREEEIDMPVIVLSAVSQREAVIRAYQAGVKSYLIKPLKPDQILKKTLEILRANF